MHMIMLTAQLLQAANHCLVTLYMNCLIIIILEMHGYNIAMETLMMQETKFAYWHAIIDLL